MADGDVVVEIRATAGAFNRSLGESKRQLEQFDRRGQSSTRAANQFGRNVSQAGRRTDRFAEALRRSADQAAFLTGPLGGVSSRLTLLSRAISSGTFALLGLSAAGAGVAAALAASVNEAEQFETSQFRVQAVLKATGFSAGLTAQEIRNLSEEIALTTLASTQGVERAATKLLTFKTVQGDVFRDALRLSQDLAEVGFGSVESGATQLGKALEDPITGLTALRRIGVSFTNQQKEQIKTLSESGRVVEAQRIIIATLQNQVGGAGAAAAGGLAGAYDTLGQRVSEFGQGLAVQTGALQATTNFINSLAGAVQLLNEALFDTPQERLDELLQRRDDLGDPTAFRNIFRAAPGPFGILGKIFFGDDPEAIEAEIKKLQAQIGDPAAAQAAAAAARKQFEEEVRLAKQRKAAADEAKRLEKARATTTRTLNEEIAKLQQIVPLYGNHALTLKTVSNEQERLTTLAKLHLDEQSEEAKQISALILQKQRLAAAIEHETSLREIAAESTAQIRGIETEIESQKILGQAIGGTEKEIRAAQIAAEKYRLEQEMLSEIILTSGEVTDEQREAIRNSVNEYEIAATRLSEITAAQERARQATEEFQDTLAEGLTDAIFQARSFEDVLKSMILQISRAIVQAQILKAIQSSGVGSSVGGTIAAAVFHKGGTVGKSGESRSVSPATFIAAPRFHNGLRPDEFPAILQRGEEVIPKDQTAARRANEQVVNYNVNVTTPDADSFRMSQRQIARKLRRSTAVT